ncbi:P-loop containing nucleoside triphosphate hydrolase protein [Protomyces lactucae-debilis]|uniref:p-loop containing nucleoside triphosphate hydrolase protein n=1 Tax=Protomyces lactucae-debilis TaxID=2754530 RepID=A0A1Y2F7Z2_PROLT|nr:P-loop containing nucleoside triphosphate hydrolase protein [Protomyces lactucae-debilis]ORY80011.1 P-loop containing nucleoside triphosphate hydrolase protein [Protomyces lactucae-debilis]
MERGTQIDRKIVILGQQGVGKSSLVLRYVNQTFQENGASTIGASFLAKKVQVDETTVRLQIWDTAGQERFRSMAPMYYRGSHAAILCYDLTSRDSFETMHSWLAELRKNMPDDILIHLVGTKTDRVRQDPSLRQVTFGTSVAYAVQHLGLASQEEGFAICHEVSAKDEGPGNGVEALFLAIVKRLVETAARTDSERAMRSRGNMVGMGSGVHIADKSARKKSNCC